MEQNQYFFFTFQISSLNQQLILELPDCWYIKLQ